MKDRARRMFDSIWARARRKATKEIVGKKRTKEEREFSNKMKALEGWYDKIKKNKQDNT